LDEQDLADAKQPWRMRYSALQNITLNLPRLGYASKGDDTLLFEKISDLMELAVKAHIEKKDFIEKLLAHGEKGPLSLLTMKKDGIPYLRMNRASYLIGMLGLNELVHIHIGEELHESKKALKFGLKIMSHMDLLVRKLGKKHAMKFVLEQTPAESTAYRFARLDLKYHSPQAGHYVKGDISRGEVYYTNSTYFSVSSDMSPIDRVIKEGLFHPRIEAGSLTHVWLGEKRPSKESLANFVIKTFRESLNDQIAFSPEFTNCLSCERTTRGLKDDCEYCGSHEVEGITRITGYFTKVSSWNKGKRGELHDRYRNGKFFSNG
jgi:ribonucleoside-triphosphate reductase